MEIRIKMSDAEYDELQRRSNTEGFPSLSAYARSLLFPVHDYKGLWAQLKVFVASQATGTTFRIRDAIPNPPALIGRWAWDRQDELGIEYCGKDRTGTNLWRIKTAKMDK